MLLPVIALTALGIVLGALLSLAHRLFRVQADDSVAEVEALLPGTNCGQCGFAGCAGAAAALAEGRAPATCCPGGGSALATALAQRLGLALDPSAMADEGPKLAVIAEELCIGCCRCIKSCPTDAIVGAAKQIHGVLREACTGCGNCIERCPTEAVALRPVPVTLAHWVWPRPVPA
ncbi:MAG TPA: RnfABCDGE type electron transport complex subunit B [Burkholderiales bacterium]|nr:RnfABCDGE type electron transport complex subunit B [Burkholderiales bacterium]